MQTFRDHKELDNQRVASYTIISSNRVDFRRESRRRRDVRHQEFIEFFLAMFTLRVILLVFIKILFSTRAHCRSMVIDCRLVLHHKSQQAATCHRSILYAKIFMKHPFTDKNERCNSSIAVSGFRSRSSSPPPNAFPRVTICWHLLE